MYRNPGSITSGLGQSEIWQASGRFSPILRGLVSRGGVVAEPRRARAEQVVHPVPGDMVTVSNLRGSASPLRERFLPLTKSVTIQQPAMTGTYAHTGVRSQGCSHDEDPPVHGGEDPAPS
jgi:hypothetical protein